MKAVDAELYMASDEWETEQQAIEAQRISGAGVPERAYRVVEAAKHTVETIYFDEWKKFNTDAAVYDCLPLAAMDAGQRCLAFRLQSRGGCSVEYHLRHPHSILPCRGFYLLWDPSIADVLNALPPCFRDQRLFAPHMAQFPGDALAGEESLDALRAAALVMLNTNVHIESCNATLRRIAYKTPHAMLPTRRTLSARWVLHRTNTRLVMSRILST